MGNAPVTGIINKKDLVIYNTSAQSIPTILNIYMRAIDIYIKNVKEKLIDNRKYGMEFFKDIYKKIPEEKKMVEDTELNNVIIKILNWVFKNCENIYYNGSLYYFKSEKDEIPNELYKTYTLENIIIEICKKDDIICSSLSIKASSTHLNKSIMHNILVHVMGMSITRGYNVNDASLTFEKVQISGINTLIDFNIVIKHILSIFNNELTNAFASQDDFMYDLLKIHDIINKELKKECTTVLGTGNDYEPTTLKGGNLLKFKKRENTDIKEHEILSDIDFTLNVPVSESYYAKEVNVFDILGKCIQLCKKCSFKNSKDCSNYLYDDENKKCNKCILSDTDVNNHCEEHYNKFIKIWSIFKKNLWLLDIDQDFKQMYDKWSLYLHNLITTILNSQLLDIPNYQSINIIDLDKTSMRDVTVIRSDSTLKRIKNLHIIRNINKFHEELDKYNFITKTSIKKNTNLRILDLEVYNHKIINGVSTITGFDLLRLGLGFKIHLKLCEGIIIKKTINAELLDYSSVKPFTAAGYLHTIHHNNQIKVNFKVPREQPYLRKNITGAKYNEYLISPPIEVNSYNLIYFIDDILYISLTCEKQAKHEKRLIRIKECLQLMFPAFKIDIEVNLPSDIEFGKLVKYLLNNNYFTNLPNAITIIQIMLDKRNVIKSVNTPNGISIEDIKYVVYFLLYILNKNSKITPQKIEEIKKQINLLYPVMHEHNKKGGNNILLMHCFKKNIIFVILIIATILLLFVLYYSINDCNKKYIFNKPNYDTFIFL
jgi:hypothetical protein